MDLLTGDFCCRRLFVLPGLGCCRGQVLGVEVRFDLLCQFQPGLVLRVSVGVHQDRCGGMTCIHLDLTKCRVMVTMVLPFSLNGVPAPFRRRFPAHPYGVIAGYPMQTIMRFSKCEAGTATKKVATKQTGHAFAFSEGLASRLCSDLKSQKGELPSPAGAERICKNMLYSIVGIDYHKNRAVST